MNSAVFSLTPDPSPRGRGAKENRRKFLLQYLWRPKPKTSTFRHESWLFSPRLGEWSMFFDTLSVYWIKRLFNTTRQ